MVNWLNDNSGFVMAILTLVYVLTTILISLANNRTAKIAQKQLAEMKNQSFEMNRGVLIAKFQEINKHFILSFENIGKSIIENAEITISNDFLDIFETAEQLKIQKLLIELTKQKHYFSPNQIINYFIYELCTGNTLYDRLKESIVKFNFEYITLGKKIKENYEINLNPILASCYGLKFEEIMQDKLIDSISKITEKLKNQNDILCSQNNIILEKSINENNQKSEINEKAKRTKSAKK